jgi:hypothetical protein
MAKNQFRSIIKAKMMASRIALKEIKQKNHTVEDKMKKEMKAQAKETWKKSKASGIRLKKPKYRIDNTDNSDLDLDEYFEDLNKFDPYGLVSEF